MIVARLADTAKARPGRLPAAGARLGVRIAARDLALLGMSVVAAGALVTVGPRAWLVACVALSGVVIGLATTRSAERSALGEIVFASVAVAVLFAGLNAIRPVGSLAVSDLALAAALGFVGIALLVDPSRGVKIAPPGWLLAAAAGFLVAGLLIELFPPHHLPQLSGFTDPLYAGRADGRMSTNLSGALRLAATVLLVPVLIAAAAASRRRVRFLAELWIAGVMISGLVGILGYYGVSIAGDLGGTEHWGPRFEQVGLTVHPNTLGLTSAMTLPIVIARLGSADWKRRLYYLAVIAVLVGAIAVSGSRVALVAGALGVALILVLNSHTRKLAALLGIVAVVSIGLSSVADLGWVPVIERFRYEGIVDERRVILYEEGLRAIGERPIVGYGFENLRGAHNIYLQVLQAGGLLSLLSFLLLLAGALTVGRRCARSADLPPDLRALANGLTASIAVWLVAGLVLNHLLDRFLYVPIGLLLAIAAILAQAQASQDQPLERHRPESGTTT